MPTKQPNGSASTSPKIADVIERLIGEQRERNPKLLERTLKSRRSHFRYLSGFFPGPIQEMTQEDIEAFAKAKENLVSRATLMIDLRALEDCLQIAGADTAPATAVLDKLRKRSCSGRHVPKPEYARLGGYRSRKQGSLKAETPPKRDTWVKATIINEAQKQQVVEGDCLSSVLLEAVIEIDRQAKAGRRTFVIMIGGEL